ncbi:SCP2 sterol-binding domain-containing protein [Paremcibacter congregatus]|uniref:Sterol-binding protein n=1 Tax=Paremcibacter congregatus TaxID=2043170 RepID=A0A2G4YRD2_9PROT|nr:SCP2 sterol-binding domain-containing protein [Paremcibacter congregatus]PHZ84882.1 sterol-binding protein [Paremcibacter congregatus]QDE26144.1 SCP2 sterol-binding domain-containing protein [Paremcibacter congregatus]|tara:strand:+ start:17911 stop:18210 length:300 start_codon:yes stop_codon:yes gene_type:complete
MSLEDLTSTIRGKTDAMDANGKKVKIDLKGDGFIFIDGTTNPPTVSNDDLDADVTLTLSEDNFEGLIDGSLNPQMAFMMGKLKIDGDMGLALKLGELFG